MIRLPDYLYQWNRFYMKCMAKVIEELSRTEKINVGRLKAYSNNQIAVDLLKQKYSLFFNED